MFCSSILSSLKQITTYMNIKSGLKIQNKTPQAFPLLGRRWRKKTGCILDTLFYVLCDNHTTENLQVVKFWVLHSYWLCYSNNLSGPSTNGNRTDGLRVSFKDWGFNCCCLRQGTFFTKTGIVQLPLYSNIISYYLWLPLREFNSTKQAMVSSQAMGNWETHSLWPPAKG